MLTACSLMGSSFSAVYTATDFLRRTIPLCGPLSAALVGDSNPGAAKEIACSGLHRRGKLLQFYYNAQFGVVGAGS